MFFLCSKSPSHCGEMFASTSSGFEPAAGLDKFFTASTIEAEICLQCYILSMSTIDALKLLLS